MATSPSITILEAVTAALNSEPFTPAFTAERRYTPIYDLKAENGLKVFVLLNSSELDPANRAHTRCSVKVDIALVQKFTSATEVPEIDMLIGLEDAIAQYLTRRHLATTPQTQWHATRIRAYYDGKRLRTAQLFLGIVESEYDALIEIG